MKVALPLAALGLVAAIFLSARDKGDLADLFTAEELATLGAGLKLDNPRFAGVTSRGESFAVQADWAMPDSAMPRLVDLEKPRGEIELADGRRLTASAETGRMLRREKVLVLEGTVVLDSSDGYHMETARVEFDLEGNFIRTFGEVGQSAGTFARPKGIATDEKGRLWVSDGMSNIVQGFSMDGTVKSALGTDLDEWKFVSPRGLFFKNGQMFLVNRLRNQVVVFNVG